MPATPQKKANPAAKQRAAAIARIRRDPRLWFEIHGHYRHEETRLPTRSRANVLQRRMFSYYAKCLAENKPCRMVACKYRRAGSSTGGEAMLYLHALNHRARLGVIGTDYRASTNMMEMFKFFLEHDDFPGWSARSAVTESRKVSWEEWFDGADLERVSTDDRVDRMISTKVKFRHDTEVELYTAKNSVSARSAGLNGYHATEVAHWPHGGVHDASETLKSMRQTLPKKGFHYVLEESTANGAQGEFYDTCLSAKWPEEPWAEQFKTIFPLTEQRFEKDLQFVFIFAAWFEDERHVPSRPLSAADEQFIRETLDEDEKLLIERFGQDGPRGQRLGGEVNATVWEQLAWRRGIIANVCTKNGVEEFKQEYPSDPKEAFRASGSPALDPMGVAALQEMCKGIESEYGNLAPQSSTDTVSFDRCGKNEGVIQVWERPFEGGEYLVSVDCMSGAEQVTGTGVKDRHAAFVFRRSYKDDHDALHQTRIVARIKPPCEWDEKVLARTVFQLAKYYGMATIVVEVEGGCGTALDMDLLELGANLYQRPEFDSATQKTTLKLGWRTTKNSRPVAIGELKHYVREQLFEIHCPHAVGELASLVVNKEGKEEAASGCHDDDAMSLAIGLACISHAHKYPKRPPVRRQPRDLAFWR